MSDVKLAARVARAALGRDPGPLVATDSLSHHVYIGADVVVKLIDAAGHSRLDREIALVPGLPGGLTAPLLASGVHTVDGRDVRYACYTRAPGAALGMGMPGAGAATVRSMAEQAVRRLGALHQWVPAGEAAQVLREPLEHGGFVSRAGLFAEIEGLAAADREGAVPARLLDGLTAIAQHAPAQARVAVPVHADCHWGNWLAADGQLTALLDFEWARFGDPLDDWFYVIADSSGHLEIALEVVAGETGIAADVLRAECEVREATYLASDIRLALTEPTVHGWLLAQRLSRLESLIVDRLWWSAVPGR
ncbi:phosphotransferase [Actinoplanes sp. NPDC024001]|uniref:phosphotransferase family protein n=1 Tax=Actinoplanes sp. NPDC024001 TaxID=3154598 RepID=UPI0033DA84DC